MAFVKKNSVPIVLALLLLVSFQFAGISWRFLASEVYTRFVRNTLFTFALILPITCGMGINFAIVVGSISAQAAMIFAMNFKLQGGAALAFIVSVSMLLSVLFGFLVAGLLNKARGREMIVSIIIGQLAAVLYQLVFLVLFGTVIPPGNADIMLDSGIGVKNVLDMASVSAIFDSVLPFTFDGKVYSLLPLLIVIFFGGILYLIQKTRLGTLAKAVGTDSLVALKLGVKRDRVRTLCIIISTVFASMSQVLYVADLGTTSVYTGHTGLETFAAAAILVGGASIKKAGMVNCVLGVLLFHALFVVSPLAGQNLFSNPSVGEYFRSFLAYGVIVIALAVNLKAKEAA